MWLEVRNLFGGAGAFLALPPQCVPDRYVVKMTAKNFASWLRLLAVAWRTLDSHARLTLNDLVRMSLARQPLPEGVLALEMSEHQSHAAPTSLSDMLTGWSASDRNSADDENRSVATLKPREAADDAAGSGTDPVTTGPASRTEKVPCAEPNSPKQAMVNVEDGLLDDLEDLDFNEYST